ncbi:MAG: hypothetical protein M1275_02470 [Patescibacteria group bacterium]|nr:hypothetical protein [Patescibacteria group bacterium]
MDIEKEIEIIKQRNLRVEADKAWELSWIRRLFITALTYALAGLWLQLVGLSRPWLSALVPALGYLLSTLSLGSVKTWWLGRHHRKP